MHDARGGFNVGPDGWVTVSEIATATNRDCICVPFWLARLAVGFAWWMRLPGIEVPSGLLYFARYPWVVASDRSQAELGFTFRFCVRQAMEAYLLAKDRARK